MLINKKCIYERETKRSDIEKCVLRLILLPSIRRERFTERRLQSPLKFRSRASTGTIQELWKMISGVRDDTEDLYTGTTTRTEAVVNEIVFKEIVMNRVICHIKRRQNMVASVISSRWKPSKMLITILPFFLGTYARGIIRISLFPLCLLNLLRNFFKARIFAPRLIYSNHCVNVD